MRIYYLIVALIIFFIELLVIKTEGFIRYTVGDFLVVIMIYCLLRSIKKISARAAAISVFILSFVIEFVQLTQISKSELFKEYEFLQLVLGTSFSIEDLIAYSLGIALAYFIDKRYSNPST